MYKFSSNGFDHCYCYRGNIVVEQEHKTTKNEQKKTGKTAN